MSRGALIVVEGIDRSGKSTQCDLLVKALQDHGYPTKLMNFPNRTTTIGKIIDSYLMNKRKLGNHAIHLLFSANRWEASKSMKKDLMDGVTLVVDRYAFSGVAYSAAKLGMDFKWCKNSDAGLPKPDLVMFLDLNASEAQKRPEFGGERYEEIGMQKNVYDNFKKLRSEKWEMINASRSKEEINREMVSLAKKAIEDVKGKDIEKLWTDE